MDSEVLVLASLIYYFTMNAQIQSPIQRMYCVNAPAKVKKMALLDDYLSIMVVIYHLFAIFAKNIEYELG
jgi:hypothetical protein